MAIHDYVIANQNGANTRSDLNNAFSAIVSNNSSATEPTTTYAYQWWADTGNDLLKQRNAADSAWISILTLSTGAVSNAAIADDAVTLAKMAAGTDGELITYDTSGDPTTVPTGSSGEVLTSNGAGTTPTFQTAAGGGKVLQVVHGGMSLGYINTTSTSWQNAYSTTITVNKGSDVLFEVGGLNARISNASYTCRTKVEATDGTNTAFWYSGTKETTNGSRITNSTKLTTASGAGTVVVTVTLYYNTEYAGATAYLYDYSDYYKTFYKIWEISA